ncbi:MAG: lysophospholipid acyltransferase family protein [Porticoccaceae bacterium]
MGKENLDPRLSDYIQDDPTLSYVQETDPWIIQKFISAIEIMFGRRKLEAIYKDLQKEPFSVESFFSGALDATKIQGCYDQNKLSNLPKTGPLVFVANHPFGVVDGLLLIDMAIKARGNFRVLINALLCRDRNLAPHFLPIDFEDSKAAAKNNIRTKKMAQQCLKEDIPLLIFPSGCVSTADRKGFGKVVDAPWTTFAAKLIRDSEATVVPVYFEGQNSRLFHIASHISEPLRMALLLNEASNKFDTKVSAHIGDHLSWSDLEDVGNRQELTNFLYRKVNELSEAENVI